MYESITKFAGTLKDRETHIECYCEQMDLQDFEEALYGIEGLMDQDYFGTLKRYGLDTDERKLKPSDVAQADLPLVRALLTFCVRSERFCEGSLTAHAKSGFLDDLLLRLQELGKHGATTP